MSLQNISFDSIFFADPLCLKRLGSSVFLKIPLYRRSTSLTPIYINNTLFTRFFGEQPSFKKQAELIQHYFSVTLDAKQSSGAACGFAFVDRQAEDPYGLSLRGNAGSGRAFYTGQYFNIKGEKTPFATAAQPQFSNGILSMGNALWGTLVANALQGELRQLHETVLTVLMINNNQCLIVRIDEEGSLDRLTHLFYQPKPLTEPTLQTIASDLGRYEAEKFLSRINHGSWSAGNTTIKGHLLDCDTVCAVKGRQPQFSVTPSFENNYFGFEYLGQLKNLYALCQNPLINCNNVQSNTLEPLLMESFHQHIENHLPCLMGLDTSTAHNNKLHKLAQLFLELSPLTLFKTEHNLHTNHPTSLCFHLFDFSAFFRMYPLMRYTEQYTETSALTLLTASQLQGSLWSQEQLAEPLKPLVQNAFSSILLTDFTDVNQPLDKAKQFIQLYHEVFTELSQSTPTSINHIIARAYVINEDRLYLFPVFSLESWIGDLLERNTETYVVHRYLQNMIQACRRIPDINSSNQYTSDCRLYKEGFVHVLINTNGTYQVEFHLYQDLINFKAHKEDVFEIDILSELFQTTWKINGDLLQITSVELPIIELSYHYSRDHTFLMSSYLLYHNGSKLKLSDLYFPDMEYGYYL